MTMLLVWPNDWWDYLAISTDLHSYYLVQRKNTKEGPVLWDLVWAVATASLQGFFFPFSGHGQTAKSSLSVALPEGSGSKYLHIHDSTDL